MHDFLIAALQPWLQAMATAVLSVVVPLLPMMVGRYLAKRYNRSVLAAAFDRAAAVAYGHVAKGGGRITDPDTVARAVEAGTMYLMDLVPDTMRKEGVPPEDARRIVEAGFDKLLAIDPNVSVGVVR